jgi:hypothetical protein
MTWVSVGKRALVVLMVVMLLWIPLTGLALVAWHVISHFLF